MAIEKGRIEQVLEYTREQKSVIKRKKEVSRVLLTELENLLNGDASTEDMELFKVKVDTSKKVVDIIDKSFDIMNSTTKANVALKKPKKATKNIADDMMKELLTGGK